MTRQPSTTSDPPMKGLKVTSPELPRLDVATSGRSMKALVEILPASDPIALSPHSPDSEKLA